MHTNSTKIVMSYFNALLGKENSFFSITANKYRNQRGPRLVEMCKTLNLTIMSTQLTNQLSKQKIGQLTNVYRGECKIDHKSMSNPNYKELIFIYCIHYTLLYKIYYVMLT